jgi:hypothetical protein
LGEPRGAFSVTLDPRDCAFELLGEVEVGSHRGTETDHHSGDATGAEWMYQVAAAATSAPRHRGGKM